MDVTGATVGPTVQETFTSDCTTSTGLLPGTYTLAKFMPSTDGRQATEDASLTVTIELTRCYALRPSANESAPNRLSR